MTAIKLANALTMVVCGYISLSYLILMIREGRKWILFVFSLAFALVMGAAFFRAGYAHLTRILSPEADRFNPWMDENRGLFYLCFAVIMLIGAIIHDNELREVKVYKRQGVIWSCIVGAAVLFALL